MIKEEYLKVANLPQRKVSTVIVDYKICDESLNTLKKHNINVIKTKPHSKLYEAINSHPDMQIQHIKDNIFVCEKSLFDYYKSALPDAKIIKGNSELEEKYPNDINYNSAVINNYVFHNLKYTDSKLLEYYNSNGAKLINIKQGYSKCSVCILNENAIITSDLNIAKKAEKLGINALYIEPYEIRLKSMSNGLIGGICGLIDKDLLAINGNIEKIVQGKQFLDFCKKNQTNVLYLNNDIPEDIGSIIPIKEYVD